MIAVAKTKVPDPLPPTLTFVQRNVMAWFAFVASIVFVSTGLALIFVQPSWQTILSTGFFGLCFFMSAGDVRKGPSEIKLTKEGYSIGSKGRQTFSYSWDEFEDVLMSDLSGQQEVFLRRKNADAAEPYADDLDFDSMNESFESVWIRGWSPSDTKNLFEAFLQRHQKDE